MSLVGALACADGMMASPPFRITRERVKATYREDMKDPVKAAAIRAKAKDRAARYRARYKAT